jgi:choice-of-anchor B domain-containing protein
MSLARCCLTLAGLAALASPAFPQVTTRNMALLSHRNDFPNGGSAAINGNNYSACWSYIHGDGREYAVLGTAEGTAIYNVTDPAGSYLVGFIPGPATTWREMKSYRNWIYVVTDLTGAGVQIIRMTDPEQPVLAATYAADFTSAHTVSVDTTRALLFCNGTAGTGDLSDGNGMRILSLADPEAPVELSWWPGGSIPIPHCDYVHDSVPFGNLLYASTFCSRTLPVSNGRVRVLDISDPTQPTEIAAWAYPGHQITHSAWPDASGNWLYVADERNDVIQPLKIFDVSNLAAPVLVNEITSNPRAVIHNPRVKGNELYLANYTEGVRVLDITDPAHPAEFAWADSWPGPSGGWDSVWEVCPYFPSGTAIASDDATGLYVYRPVRDYGILRVTMVDAGTLLPLQGITVALTTQGDSLTTPADGIVQFAPSPGTHTVRAREFGYADASATRELALGSREAVTLAMVAAPRADFGGSVSNAVSGAALEGAEIVLTGTPLPKAFTDQLGRFRMDDIPSGLYQIEVRRPGFVPSEVINQIGPDATQRDFQLAPACIWDALESESGWEGPLPAETEPDNAIRGQWVRVEPLGTRVSEDGHHHRAKKGDMAGGGKFLTGSATAGGSGVQHLGGGEGDGAPPGQVQPELDRSPPPGSFCFVTGQGTDSLDFAEADVDNGKTTLASPMLDVTAMTDPRIGYWRWFYGSGPDDRLEVWLYSLPDLGRRPISVTAGIHNEWHEQAIRVRDYTVGNLLWLTFVAVDAGEPSIVEAGIDDLILYDAANPLGCVPTPTLVTGFEARATSDGVDLAWSSGASDRIAAWNVYRGAAIESPFELVNPEPIPMGSGGTFQLHDAPGFTGTVHYRLAALMRDGSEQVLEIRSLELQAAPQTLAIRLAGGNPFRGATTIAYELPERSPVRLEVFSVGGERVRTLVNGVKDGGAYHTIFNLRTVGERSLAAGIYLVRLVAGKEQRQLRLVALD